jgi:hypothetical protein
LLVLPQASEAFHVMVRVYAPHSPEAWDTSETTFTVAPLQASFAVGAVKEGTEGHVIVVLAPALPIVGAVISLTVIDWLTLPLVLPQPSEAFHVLVHTLAQLLPVLTVETIFGVSAPWQASLAVGAVNEGVVVAGHPLTELLLPGLPISGAVTSLTVID